MLPPPVDEGCCPSRRSASRPEPAPSFDAPQRIPWSAVLAVPFCQVSPLLPCTVHAVLSPPTKVNSFGLLELPQMFPGPPLPFVPYLAPELPAQNNPHVAGSPAVDTIQEF